MQTGDGLLVRLRPTDPGFAPGQLAALAAAAEAFGNGILEVTARGNLQIRGLTADTVPQLAAAVRTAGIAIAEAPAIETPPLAGLDPTERADPLPLARALRSAIAARRPAFGLAAKLSLVVDGGGRFHLGDTSADIRLRAVCSNDNNGWLLGIAGSDRTATWIGHVDEASAVAAVLVVLEELDRLGGAARGRDLDAVDLGVRLGSLVATAGNHAPADPAPLAAGIHDLGAAGKVLGLGLAFGQSDAASLSGLVSALEALGTREIRLAPGHGLLALGLDAGTLPQAQARALDLGFRIFPEDPGNSIAVCAGKGACASGHIDTRATAGMLMTDAPELLDGSLTVHVSGCTKGCAKPSASMLTLAGAPMGYGLVVNGAASTPPRAYIEEKTIKSAIGRLAALVRDNKRAGESARSCLTRLGADATVAAVQ